MTSIFDFVDKDFWQKELQEPLWYKQIVPQFKILKDKTEGFTREEKTVLTQELYKFFEDLYVAGKIYFGEENGLWDSERKEIDTVIIHHTSDNPGMSPDKLSAIEIIRLYAPFYFAPHTEDGGLSKDKPISSGHIRDGRQVFWPYHWIIRAGGITERLLHDNEVGWQAGNWEVNCRSVGIVIDNDLENSEPSGADLEAVAKLIRESYPQVKPENILGHMEVNEKTVCPSKLFLGEGGWKAKLIAALRRS